MISVFARVSHCLPASDVSQLRREGLPVQGALDEDDGPRRRGEPAALGPVGGPGTLDAGLRVMTRHRGERHRVPAKHAVQPEVRRDDIEKPGDGGRLKALAARRMHSGWPARWYVRSHLRIITPGRTVIRVALPAWCSP